MYKKKYLWCFLGATLVLGLLASSVWGCYAIVVGKDASVDGAVLLGHNEQNDGQRFINFRKVPRIRHKAGEKIKLTGGAQIEQVGESYAFLWSENPGASYSDAYLNEWGVAIVSDACRGHKEGPTKLEVRGQLTQGGISYLLRRLIIERAKTAREGVQIGGQLIEQVGYPQTRTLVIADRNEAWLLSMAGGRHWAAQRVPDDEVVLLPSVYIIGEINPRDKKNFLCSPGLIEYATERGWYNPAGGKPFRFWQVFGPERKKLMDIRQWRGQCEVTGKIIAEEPDRQLPFSVRPDRKLSIKDVVTILRFHGQGAICNKVTQEAAVFQLRSKLPTEIGCVYWRTSAAPCTSVLTPWYIGITETPHQYYQQVDINKQLTLEHHFSESPEKFRPDDKHAWWVFKKLQDEVRRDYAKRVKIVRQQWDKYEAWLFDEQAEIERKALKLYRKDKSAAMGHLTDYCRNTAIKAVNKARELTGELERK